MAPIAPTKGSTSPVILLAIVALGLILGYFYYASVLKDEAVTIPAFEIPADDNLAKFKDIKLDFSFVDDLKFGALKIFGESPVQPGVTGKTDIFAPF